MICPLCFGERGLKAAIQRLRPQFPRNSCDFHPSRKGIPSEQISKIIDRVFREYYQIGDWDPRCDDLRGLSLEEVLEEVAEFSEEIIANVIIRDLMENDSYWPGDGEDRFYSRDYWYVPKNVTGYYQNILWDKFCKSIMYEQRFFNNYAKSTIVEIFDKIHTQKDNKNSSPVYELAPSDGAIFFRARVVDSLDVHHKIQEHPSKEMGAPPKNFRRAGRMNASGIPAFYGAFDKDTCVAELRPIVGSLIAIAQFELIRPIYVLDTTKFERPVKEGSFFSLTHMKKVEQWQFMQNFMHKIAQPISLGDEHLEYIPTQVVSEFLLENYTFSIKSKTQKIEAIVFQSAQNGKGRNIAILGGASSVSVNDNLETAKTYFFENDLDDLELSKLNNPPALRLIEKSVEFVKISKAKYEAEPLYEEY